MNSIRVQLREPTPKGRLYYHHDPETEQDLLLIKSQPRERWAYFVSISGEVLLDMDANRILRSVTVVLPQRSRAVDPLFEIPTAAQSADLEIDIDQKHEAIDLSVSVRTDAKRTFACVLFGRLAPNATWVALSSDCLALIVDSELRGFFVLLNPWLILSDSR